MCGRYNLITDSQALIHFFEVYNTLEIIPRYNIAPSQEIPVVRAGSARRELRLMRWGLVPRWAKDEKIGYKMINARAETVAEKPSFKNAFRYRRCLIPATGFYEWKAVKGGKQSYNIRLTGKSLFAFAGLWESWKREDGSSLESCSVIVTEANEAICSIHNRMPVILSPTDYETWLEPKISDPELLKPLLRPCPATWIESYPVSRLVGNPKNNDSECVAPLAESE